MLGIKLQVALNRTVRHQIDRQIGAVLHLMNLSTRSDARRLSRQLTVLTGEVRKLSEQADELFAQARQLEQRQRAAQPAQRIPEATESGTNGGHGT